MSFDEQNRSSQEAQPMSQTSVRTNLNLSPTSTTIDRLAWMAGSWSGHVDDDPIDEHWSLPAGDVMMGMFRWLKQGRLYLYELLAIEPEAEGLVLRLKHFDPGLNGWEEKGAAVAYPLVGLGDREAIFERGGTFRSTRFVYKRTSERELLVVTEDRRGEEIKRYEFRYARLQFVAG
jgi:hypothetical protein